MRLGIGLALLASSACGAAEHNILIPAGVLNVKTEIFLDGAQLPSLVAEMTNRSQLPIQKLHLCISSPSLKKGCLFTTYITREMAAGESITVNLSGQRKVRNTAHSVLMDDIVQYVPPAPRKPTPLDSVRKVYVAEIGGNAGPMVREELIAAIINTGRFILVRDLASADAAIEGRAETREVTRTSSNSSSFGSGTLTSVPFQGPRASEVSGARSSTVGGTMFLDSVALHLTTGDGQAVWAWDGTKPCTVKMSKCAVEDLLQAAK